MKGLDAIIAGLGICGITFVDMMYVLVCCLVFLSTGFVFFSVRIRED